MRTKRERQGFISSSCARSQLKSICASFINSLNRRFDFVDDTQFLNIFMNVANCQLRRQLNEIENPHQLVAAARHVTDCNCEINNHFMNFFPFELILQFKNRLKFSCNNNKINISFTTSKLRYFWIIARCSSSTRLRIAIRSVSWKQHKILKILTKKRYYFFNWSLAMFLQQLRDCDVGVAANDRLARVNVEQIGRAHVWTPVTR